VFLVRRQTHQVLENSMIRTIEEVRERYKAKQLAPTLLDFSTEVLGVYLPEGWKEGHEDNVKDYPRREAGRQALCAVREGAAEAHRSARGLGA
jgi:hypothetical protein